MIRLRKPPIIQLHEEYFLPEVDLKRVDQEWDLLCEQNPGFFDGEITHVFGVSRTGCGGAIIQAARTSYRFHAVKNCGISPLGAKGQCVQEGKYLCGLRGSKMGAYAQMWEFAPAGIVEPDQLPENTIRREIEEETGLALQSPPIAISLFFDTCVNTWEIVYQLKVTGELKCDGKEYESLEWFDIKSLPKPMSPPAMQMRSLL